MSVSRRGFLVASAAVGLSVAGLTGCSSPSQKKDGTSEDGDAQAQAKPQPQQATETKECDVVVVGLGAGGLAAACKASREGAKVIGIDLAQSMDGTTNTLTSGAWVCGTSWHDPLNLIQPQC